MIVSGRRGGPGEFGETGAWLAAYKCDVDGPE